MKQSLKPVRGMHDVLPEEQGKWQLLEEKVAKVFAAYGYDLVRTPILEHQDLFFRTVGEDSDIVKKELFSIASQKDRDVCMRPEGTVPTVRAMAAAGLLRGQNQRVWYQGPMFRRERPQKGRSRQFHQFGAEMLGQGRHEADVEIVLLCARIWRELGIEDKVRLSVNNLGSQDERKEYGKRLRDFFKGKEELLSPVDRTRARDNPLRVLDSKERGIEKVLEDAPSIEGLIGDDSKRHFESFLACLDQEKVGYEIDPRLVRGLDYYNLTVFEWLPKGATGRQSAICGGGRYDGLTEALGAPSCPGVGMAAGIERILELIDGTDSTAKADVTIGMTGQAYDQKVLLGLSERLRDRGLNVASFFIQCKISTFYKHADKSGAHIAALIGSRESEEGKITIKNLRNGQQETVLQKDCEQSVLAMLGRDG